MRLVSDAADEVFYDRALQTPVLANQAITRCVSEITSGPIPSPGRKRIDFMRRCKLLGRSGSLPLVRAGVAPRPMVISTPVATA